jgi:hypothetical protein
VLLPAAPVPDATGRFAPVGRALGRVDGHTSRRYLPDALLARHERGPSPPLALALPVATASAQLAPGSTLVLTGVTDAADLGLPGVVLGFDSPVTASTSANTGAFATLNRRRAAGSRGSCARSSSAATRRPSPTC